MSDAPTPCWKRDLADADDETYFFFLSTKFVAECRLQAGPLLLGHILAVRLEKGALCGPLQGVF